MTSKTFIKTTRIRCGGLLFWVSILALTQMPFAEAEDEKDAAEAKHRFVSELSDAENGALYKSKGAYAYVDNLVHTVFVDSQGWLWVGTENGLAVNDGQRWLKRTFPRKAVLAQGDTILFSPECGPILISEGPPGTIWFGDSTCGIWKYHHGEYTAIEASPEGTYMGMQARKDGTLWVITTECTYKYSNHVWEKVLCPYIDGGRGKGNPKLFHIAIGHDGIVWIGATTDIQPVGPWEHHGTVWSVNQQQRERASGPPKAPLYAFDGTSWKAYGPPHGLNVKSANPIIDERSRVFVKTEKGFFLLENDAWQPAAEVDIAVSGPWIVREDRSKEPEGYFAEVLFREGKDLFPVRPADVRTGAALNLDKEPFRVLSYAQDRIQKCLWLGTMHGLYRIWRPEPQK